MKRDQNDSKRVWILTPFFPTWTIVEQQGSGSKHLWDQFGTFQNERDKHDFKRVWNPTPFFQHGPKWKSKGQVPSPFGTSLALFKMKGAKMISKGFGIDSVFPIWTKVEKQGSGSKRLWYQFGPFQNERDQNYFKMAWNLTQLFQHGPKWKSRGHVPNPFGTSLAPFKMEGPKLILKGFGT
jgi:hypothetical protein